MTLIPTATTTSDLRNLIRFLTVRPEGVSPLEITDIFLRRLFEPSKLISYKTWGIISNGDDLIRLSPLGRRIAEGLEREASQYRTILHSIEPYRETLRWFADEKAALVTQKEVAEFWQENYSDTLPASDSKTIGSCVVGFFNLCHMAQLGFSSTGRKGQPTRLSVDIAEVARFLAHSDDLGFSQTLDNEPTSPDQVRMMVFCDEAKPLSPVIKEIFEVADVQYELTSRGTHDLLISGPTNGTGEHCSAAIIVAGPENQVVLDGTARLEDRLLAEIIASYALFDKRVLLMWTNPSPPEVSISGLQVVCVPTEIDWQSGIRIGRLIRRLKCRH